tara:strand:- start:1388 stop:1678 length:291 start_codon:yes stop_codon:yes gene_type:complete
MSGSPADELQNELYEEEQLNLKIRKMKIMLRISKKKADLDNILKKFDIKIKKNGKIVTPMRENMDMKRRIIRFVINEPDDLFDIDSYNKLNKQKSK